MQKFSTGHPTGRSGSPSEAFDPEVVNEYEPPTAPKLNMGHRRLCPSHASPVQRPTRIDVAFAERKVGEGTASSRKEQRCPMHPRTGPMRPALLLVRRHWRYGTEILQHRRNAHGPLLPTIVALKPTSSNDFPRRLDTLSKHRLTNPSACRSGQQALVLGQHLGSVVLHYGTAE